MAYLDDNTATIKIVTEQDGDGIESTRNDLKSLGKTSDDTDGKLSSFTDNFKQGLDTVAKVSAVAGAGLTLFAKTSVDKLTDVVKSSKDLGRQTGMTTEESSRLVAAMGRMGVTSDTASISFRTLSKVIADAREDTGDMSNKLNEMGVATKNADGTARDFSDILFEVSDRFQKMPDGAEKTAASLELFGRSGTSMIKVLDGGSKAIKDLSDQADKLGLTLTPENIATVDAYIKSQKDLADQTQSLQMAVGTLTAPVLTDFNTMLNDSLQSLIGVDGPLRDVTVGFLAFGGPVFAVTAGIAEFGSNVAGAIPMVKALAGVVSTPMIMPAIAVGAAIASLVVVGDKISETIGAIDGMNEAQDNAKQIGEQTDAAMKKAHEEGRISLDKYNTYLKNTEAESYKTKDRLFTGFFGPLLQSGAELVALIQGRSMQEVYGKGKAGSKSSAYATGGFTGRGGVNEVAGVVHRGEYVLRQDQVDQSTGQPKASVSSGGSQTHYHQYDIGQVVLSTPDAVREFFTVNDYDSQMVSMGLSPNRGTA